MITPQFRCSVSALYLTGNNICQSLSDNLAVFTAFSPRYDAAFLNNLKADLETARSMPDHFSRSTQS